MQYDPPPAYFPLNCIFVFVEQIPIVTLHAESVFSFKSSHAWDRHDSPPSPPLRLFTRTSRFVYSEKRGRAENIWEYSLGEIKNSPGLRLTTLPPLLWFFPLFTVLQWLANSAIASLNLPPGLIVPVSVRFHDAFACSLVIQRDCFFFSLSLHDTLERRKPLKSRARRKLKGGIISSFCSLSLSISRSLMSFLRKGGRKTRPACSACK